LIWEEENVEHSLRDRGTRKQASEGSCFQNGELSGNGLKRCCGGRVSHNIDQHYVDIMLVEDSFVRYTQAM
jgi:hypothetical protein